MELLVACCLVELEILPVASMLIRLLPTSEVSHKARSIGVHVGVAHDKSLIRDFNYNLAKMPKKM